MRFFIEQYSYSFQYGILYFIKYIKGDQKQSCKLARKRRQCASISICRHCRVITSIFVTVHEKARHSYISFEKIRFQQNWKVLKEKNSMQKTKLHYLKLMWFYLHLANQISAWNSTKSAPLNGHYPKLQFPTYIWFSHAQSHIFKLNKTNCEEIKSLAYESD